MELAGREFLSVTATFYCAIYYARKWIFQMSNIVYVHPNNEKDYIRARAAIEQACSNKVFLLWKPSSIIVRIKKIWTPKMPACIGTQSSSARTKLDKFRSRAAVSEAFGLQESLALTCQLVLKRARNRFELALCAAASREKGIMRCCCACSATLTISCSHV